MGVKEAATTKALGVLLAATVTAATVVTGGIAPLVASDDFTLYKRPDHIQVEWYDYTSQSGAPSDGSKPGDLATPYKAFPYCAIFFGARKNTGGSAQQGYDSNVYYLFSKKPVCDVLTFAYNASRNNYGYIRATSSSKTVFGSDKDYYLVAQNWSGVQNTNVQAQVRNATTHAVYGSSTYYFDFDYMYCDDGRGPLNVENVNNIHNVPYGYMHFCSSNNGGSGGGNGSSQGSGGGGSESSSSSGGPESSGGSSSGSGESESSSSGGNESSSSGGNESSREEDESYPGSDWDQSQGGGSNPDKYPWEEGSGPGLDWEPSVPNYPGGSEGDTGEKGDTWELPSYTPQTPDIDLNIPPFPGMDLQFPSMPDATPPAFDYKPDENGGWPPPFPGTGGY